MSIDTTGSWRLTNFFEVEIALANIRNVVDSKFTFVPICNKEQVSQLNAWIRRQLY